MPYNFRKFVAVVSVCSASTLAAATIPVYAKAYGATTSPETVLYSFQGGTDGSQPWGDLIADASGNLYGTTAYGGTNNLGTVFELVPDGNGGYTKTPLYNFTGVGGDAYPYAGLHADQYGNLYGTTTGVNIFATSCSTDCGTVYELVPDEKGGYTESWVYTFTDGHDGGSPFVPLVADQYGNLYGATRFGGDAGCGTVFKIAPDGKGFDPIHEFMGGSAGCFGRPVIMHDGLLYGITKNGGRNDKGTIFRLAPDGTGYRVLHRFKGGVDDGKFPLLSKGLLAGADGNLYGTTTGGGSDAKCGVVFKIAPDGTNFTTLYNFTNSTDGCSPTGSLIQDTKGNLYGTTHIDDPHHCYLHLISCGTVFRLAPDGTNFTLLYNFTGGSDGDLPFAGLIADAGFQHLYGVTEHGGTGDNGVVFSVRNEP